jgi:hypothetical protein
MLSYGITVLSNVSSFINYIMYKQKNKSRLEHSTHPILWAKRKIMVVITAFMIGMASGMNVGDSLPHQKHNQTEQQDKKD